MSEWYESRTVKFGKNMYNDQCFKRKKFTSDLYNLAPSSLKRTVSYSEQCLWSECVQAGKHKYDKSRNRYQPSSEICRLNE